MKKRAGVWIPITVQFTPKAGSAKSQNMLLQRLQQMLEELKEQGHILESKVDVVFPNERDPDLAGIFVANIQGDSDEAARLLAQRTGIHHAYVTPQKRAFY